MVYDAVDERFLNEPLPADADRILERHAVNSPYVLYAGNIRPQKNLPRLIEAFAVAKAELRGNPEFDQLKLLVIGEALNRHADLRRAVVRARVREDVRFLGFVPSPVLRAMGVPENVLRSALRFSLSPNQAGDEIDEALDRIAGCVAQVRSG